MIIYIPIISLFLSFSFTNFLVRGEFVSPLLDPSVTSSTAFITPDQFSQAINASMPFLAVPLRNVTLLKLKARAQYAYPDFMNYAVKIGNITSQDEMAMYLAHVLYHSNGLQQRFDPMCKKIDTDGCKSLNLNATVFGTEVNYFGRGYLWLQGQSAYQDCAKDLFGNDATLLMYPDAIRANEPLNWAVSAWVWKKFVQPYMSTFGSTIKLLRPTQCTGSSVEPAPEALAAWNIYSQILKILAPTSGPSSSFC